MLGLEDSSKEIIEEIVMYELNLYNRDTEELVMDMELKDLSSEDVLRIFGFALEGNCADVSLAQLSEIEACVGYKFQQIEGDISICEIIDTVKI